jgi:uncharacterized protein
MLKAIKNDQVQLLFDPQSLNIFLLGDEAFLIADKYARKLPLSEDEKTKIAKIEELVKHEAAPHQKTSLESRVSEYKKRLNRFTIVLTSACNMRCKYCYEEPKEGGNKLAYEVVRTIDEAVARKAIDQVLSSYESVGTIMFFGGEPLLNVKLMERLCEYIEVKTKGLSSKPSIGIITNGTIFDDEVASLLKRYSVYTTVSVDGPEAIHDYSRVYANGRGSFTDVSAIVDELKDNGLPFGFQSTITPAHMKMGYGVQELGEFFRTRFDVRLPHIVPATYSPQSNQYWSDRDITRLVESYTASIRHSLAAIESGELNDVRLFSLLYGVLVSLIFKRPNPIRCPAGTELAVAPDGSYFPCFTLINEGADLLLSTVEEGLHSEGYWDRLDNFLFANLKKNNKECNSCWAVPVCHGCLGTSVKRSGDIGANDPINCLVMKGMLEATLLAIAELYRDEGRWKGFKENFIAFGRSYFSQSTVC